jgi:aminobenzoyl-glutamate transport protein
MVYFPLILTFCQRWQKDFGLGSLAATMIPYSVGLLGVGLALTIGWIALDIPLGPAAPVHYTMP